MNTPTRLCTVGWYWPQSCKFGLLWTWTGWIAESEYSQSGSSWSRTALWINGRANSWIYRFNVSQKIIRLVSRHQYVNRGRETDSLKTPKASSVFWVSLVFEDSWHQLTNGLKAFDLVRSHIRRESWEQTSAQKHFGVSVQHSIVLDKLSGTKAANPECVTQAHKRRIPLILEIVHEQNVT